MVLRQNTQKASVCTFSLFMPFPKRLLLATSIDGVLDKPDVLGFSGTLKVSASLLLAH